MPIEDVKKAYAALSGKLATYNTLFAYADGEQPLVYSTDRLREAFGNLRAHFQQNWCSVVINASLDRLNLNGWDAPEGGANTALDDLWRNLGLELVSYDVHNDALVTSEAFVIAWKTGSEIECYHNDPRWCHVFYDPERPRVKAWAAKWWPTDDGWRMTLYYPDRLEYYGTRKKEQPRSYSAFMPLDPPTAPNPFGVVPVFHFRAKGELDSILTLQDAVNKLLADMMVSAEFGAFPQRYIISNSDTASLKNGANIIWEIPASDGHGEGTQVGQFDAAPLDNYLKVINDLANSIAIISRTPKHYFYGADGSNLSGEALIAMESPLTKKVEMHQKQLGAAWRELGAFLLKLAGKTVNATDISPVWQPAESIQPLTEAMVVQTETTAGIPLVTSLRRRGWQTGEIDAMKKDRDEQDNAEYINVPEQ
jgi:hypothetical protein